jgi:hypothetical protein
MPDFRPFQRGLIVPPAYRLANAPRLARRTRAISPPPSTLAQRRSLNYGLAMDGNDRLGDCGAVGIANGARAVAAVHGYGLNITTDRVLGLYERHGYDPGDPTTDRGVVLLDVLQDLAAHEWLAEDQLPLVGPFGTVEVRDRAMLAWAMDKIDWVYAGVDLAQADMLSDYWRTDTPATSGDPTPGSEGPHCIDLLWYDGLGDDDLIYTATWGMQHPATWAWWESRGMEAHAVLFRPLDEVDYEGLAADVAALTE